MVNTYITKDGKEVQIIPNGRCKIVSGTINQSGYLTIVGRVASQPGIPKVLCKCKCGNYTVLAFQAFKNGSTRSCGCYNQELHREIGKKLGKLNKKIKNYSEVFNPYYEFLYPTEENKGRSRVWMIRCKQCKKEYKEVPGQVISDTRNRGNNPCSCWKNISKGVLKIRQILNENNISFVQEYKFSNCLTPLNKPFKFDFFVEEKYIIEYDGEQHFKPVGFGILDPDKINHKFEAQQLYDKMKNDYCLQHNIPIIRIPYQAYKTLTIQDLIPISSNYLLKGE